MMRSHEKREAMFSSAMARLRKILFWIHLVAGVAAALFISCLAVSGVCIAYERELTALIEHRGKTVTPPPCVAAPLDAETWIRRVQAARPEETFSILTVDADPAVAARISSGKGPDSRFVNPYTGEILGAGSGTAEAFFKWMTGFHRSLALPGSLRSTGRTITGAASIACFVLFATGLYIWLPRTWSLKVLKATALFHPRLKGRARDWNWHNSIGLWLSPMILVMTLTGIIMAYGWASDALFRLAGSPPDTRDREKKGEEKEGGHGDHRKDESGNRAERFGRGEPAPGEKIDIAGLNTFLEQAKEKVPDWQSITVRLSNSGPLQLRIKQANSGPSHADSRVTFDLKTGAVLDWQTFSEQSRGQRWSAWIRDIHTGEWGGWIGETLALATALGLLLLVWTGLALSWRRFFGRAKRSSKIAAAPQEEQDRSAPAPEFEEASPMNAKY
jgi:uncharacterized iron-regulated membrane protein